MSICDEIIPEPIRCELSHLTRKQRCSVLSSFPAESIWSSDSGRSFHWARPTLGCKAIDSPKDGECCDGCCVELTCKYSIFGRFDEDFRGKVVYFEAVREFLLNHKRPLVVCGTFDSNGGRPSKIGGRLAVSLNAHVLNGGILAQLEKEGLLKGYGLVVWMANVSNDIPKCYLKKDKGAVMVVSKVMREGYTRIDSTKRIFDMGGNAVIEINKKLNGILDFVLVDALSNDWKRTDDIAQVAEGIIELADWTDGSVRVGSQSDCLETAPLFVCQVVEVARIIADKVEVGTNSRYFGNLSTRCASVFPSARGSRDGAFVSPRNMDKRRIAVEDMIFARMEHSNKKNVVVYRSDRKPSVDTATQLEIYRLTDVNFLIHGHAYVEGAPVTENYFPCGDLRELEEVVPLIIQNDCNGVVNLRNHGFLMFSKDADSLREMAARAVFVDRVLSGEER